MRKGLLPDNYKEMTSVQLRTWVADRMENIMKEHRALSKVARIMATPGHKTIDLEDRPDYVQLKHPAT